MLPPVDENTFTELLAVSDACVKSFQDHDNKTFVTLIAEESSLGRLGYLLEHWVAIWHQGRPTRPIPCDHDEHPRHEDTPTYAATVLEMLNSPDQDSLMRLIEDVLDGRGSDGVLDRQIDVSAALMVALQRYLPAGALPSHYLIAEGTIELASDRVGCPNIASLLTRVTLEMWRDHRSAAAILFEERLGVRQLRQMAAVLARALAHRAAPGEPFTVIGGHPGETPEYVISSTDDPANYADREQRITAVGARIVGLVAAGKQRRIENELRNPRNLQDGVETRALVLSLALWLSARIKELPAYRGRGENDSIQEALSHL